MPALSTRPTRSSHSSARGRGHAVQRGEGVDLLARGQPLEERRGLELDADPRQQAGVARPGRQAEDRGGAGVRACAAPRSSPAVVVLPAPFGPRMPTNSPSATSKADAVDRAQVAVRHRQVPRPRSLAMRRRLRWSPAGHRGHGRAGSSWAESRAAWPRRRCGRPAGPRPAARRRRCRRAPTRPGCRRRSTARRRRSTASSAATRGPCRRRRGARPSAAGARASG